MFADLEKYDNKEYGEAHSRICFDSLYEKREYELISAFYSKVLNKGQTGFRYYAFFNADSEQEFNEFYKNIKELSIYDTGVTAEYGDEFLTLSTCAYHTNNGRFVVIAKRVK
jgi:sortase B